MRRFTARLTTTVVTLAVAAVGFAGVAVAGEQLSKKEFLKQANAVCKSANKEIDAAFGQAFEGLGENDTPTDEQFAAAVAGAVPAFRKALDDIDGLQGPGSLEKQVDKLIGQYSAVVDGFEADPATAFTSEVDPFAKADKVARKLGLKQCAQGG